MLESSLEKIIKKFKLDALTIPPTDNYYDHPTFSVGSLIDYITLIDAFTVLNSKSRHMKFFYRGVSDYRWKLIPSLMRKNSMFPFSNILEHDLAVEFRSEIPNLFQYTDSNFETLAKMQHFGIPTRLLDFTLNPLIALYFACSDLPRTPGRVVFSLNNLHHFDDRYVECISSSYLYTDLGNIKLDKWLRPYNISAFDYLFHIYSDLYMASPLFVKPIYLDDRMKAQRSVFLLFHNDIRDALADCFYYKYKEVDPAIFKHEDIENIYKEQILNPYMSMGDSPYFIVNKSSFKRLIDSYRKLNINNFNEKISAVLTNRFVLQDFISPLEPTDIWFEFGSIIISPKHKKQILSQLEHLGIDESYVYPEAEHIAKKIKKQTR